MRRRSVALALVAALALTLTVAQIGALFLFVRGFFPDARVVPKATDDFPPLFRARDEPIVTSHGKLKKRKIEIY
jgi:hypothetical protein